MRVVSAAGAAAADRSRPARPGGGAARFQRRPRPAGATTSPTSPSSTATSSCRRDYYEVLLARFAGDERLGIACGDLIEPDGSEWERLAIPPHHVHGALKLYSRECLEAIGGVQERLGWDTIDETYARMRALPDPLLPRPRRPPPPPGRRRRAGLLRGRARHGRCAWIAHFGLGWVALRGVKVGAAHAPARHLRARLRLRLSARPPRARCRASRTPSSAVSCGRAARPHASRAASGRAAA